MISAMTMRLVQQSAAARFVSDFCSWLYQACGEGGSKICSIRMDVPFLFARSGEVGGVVNMNAWSSHVFSFVDACKALVRASVLQPLLHD